MLLKNKLIPALLLLLVLANLATIAMYWFGRNKPLSPSVQLQTRKGPPSEFLVKELALDSNQKAQYLGLVKIHQTQTKDLREKTMAAKDNFFNLIKQPVLNDSLAKKDISEIGMLNAQQDMATLQHFRQVRALCNALQQQKFDSIIHQMLGIMANQRPNMPPPNDNKKEEKQMQHDGKRPPPPPIDDGQRPPPPPDEQGPPPRQDGQEPPSIK